jgi:hypothetical protein
MHADGTGQKQLASDGFAPVASPDPLAGLRIAFGGATGLSEVDGLGNVMPFGDGGANFGESLAWSTDGTRVAALYANELSITEDGGTTSTVLIGIDPAAETEGLTWR